MRGVDRFLPKLVDQAHEIDNQAKYFTQPPLCTRVGPLSLCLFPAGYLLLAKNLAYGRFGSNAVTTRVSPQRSLLKDRGSLPWMPTTHDNDNDNDKQAPSARADRLQGRVTGKVLGSCPRFFFCSLVFLFFFSFLVTHTHTRPTMFRRRVGIQGLGVGSG